MQLSHFLDVDPQPASGVFSAALNDALREPPAIASAIELLHDELPAVAAGVLELLRAPESVATRTRRTWRDADAMSQEQDDDDYVTSTLAVALSRLQPALHAAAARGQLSATPREWVLDTREYRACSRLLDLLPHEYNIVRVAVVAEPDLDANASLLCASLVTLGRTARLEAISLCRLSALELVEPMWSWAKLEQLTSLELYVPSRAALYGYRHDDRAWGESRGANKLAQPLAALTRLRRLRLGGVAQELYREEDDNDVAYDISAAM